MSVADTGLDMSSCYFKDKSGNILPAHYKTPITDGSKRKVVQYSYHQNSDSSDVIRGHGTHVCGTIAGYIENSDIYSSTLQLTFCFKIVYLLITPTFIVN